MDDGAYTDSSGAAATVVDAAAANDAPALIMAGAGLNDGALLDAAGSADVGSVKAEAAAPAGEAAASAPITEEVFGVPDEAEVAAPLPASDAMQLESGRPEVTTSTTASSRAAPNEVAPGTEALEFPTAAAPTLSLPCEAGRALPASALAVLEQAAGPLLEAPPRGLPTPLPTPSARVPAELDDGLGWSHEERAAFAVLVTVHLKDFRAVSRHMPPRPRHSPPPPPFAARCDFAEEVAAVVAGARAGGGGSSSSVGSGREPRASREPPRPRPQAPRLPAPLDESTGLASGGGGDGGIGGSSSGGSEKRSKSKSSGSSGVGGSTSGTSGGGPKRAYGFKPIERVAEAADGLDADGGDVVLEEYRSGAECAAKLGLTANEVSDAVRGKTLRAQVFHNGAYVPKSPRGCRVASRRLVNVSSAMLLIQPCNQAF